MKSAQLPDLITGADEYSFGSAWFPFARPDIVQHLLDTLIESDTPFLFAYATELFPVPPELFDRIKDCDIGLAVQVAPQLQVLSHKSILAFVSHCGVNSMSESIACAVPVVSLAFCGDQGEHAELRE